MKIWFDILTPKELLFFEPMVKDLKKRHKVLCTSRKYGEVSHLARIRRFQTRVIGRYGGAEKLGKLKAGTQRVRILTKEIARFSPDLTVSFCSPDAARVAFGLGIPHIGFQDSPHHHAALRLTVPLIQKLLTPWLIPKKEFVKFGISQKDIIQYRSIDAALLIKRKTSEAKVPFKSDKMTILVRPQEDQAAYVMKKDISHKIIENILQEYGTEDIVVLSRYETQRRNLVKKFGRKIRVIDMSYDGKLLLEHCDVFIGSGGTMTAEAALMGTPTISYESVSSHIEDYLIRKKLAVREDNPKKINSAIKSALQRRDATAKRAKREIASMVQPYSVLVKIIKSMDDKAGFKP